MEQVTRGAFGLAALVLLAGLAAALIPLPHVAVPDTAELIAAARASATDPLVLSLAGGCLVLLVAARVLRREAVVVPVRSTKFLPPLPGGAGAVEAAQISLSQLRHRLDPRSLSTTVDAIGVVELLIHGAIQSQASDVHLHPLEDGSHAALRVHGQLEEVAVLPPSQHLLLVNRLKVLSSVTVYVTDRPQDGHFTIDTPDGAAEIRISFLPTQHGENIVMRVARPGSALAEISSLGMGERLETQLQALLAKPQGLLFFTGPTGSGKTTSIYASLGHIHRSRGATTRIATIEDPIEHSTPMLSQTQVNSATGLTFAEGLRALLRQDPNVIMVGEIRDPETARIAVQAGLTGHLIVTTVHADSSAGVFNRLLEMNVEPYVLASVALACVSQRLVKQLCAQCRVTQQPSLAEAQRLESHGLRVTPFSVAVGCARCSGLGFVGRTAVYEVLIVTPKIRELIQQRVSTDQLLRAAAEEGTVPLLEAAVEAARAGVTTLAEAFRVAG